MESHWDSYFETIEVSVQKALKRLLLYRDAVQQIHISMDVHNNIECIIGISIKKALEQNKLKNLHGFYVQILDAATHGEAGGRFLPDTTRKILSSTKSTFLEAMTKSKKMPIEGRFLIACGVAAEKLIGHLPCDEPTKLKIETLDRYHMTSDGGKIKLSVSVSPR